MSMSSSKQKDSALNRGDLFAASQRGGIAGGHMNSTNRTIASNHPISNDNVQKRFKDLQAKLHGNDYILGTQEAANARMELGEIDKRLGYLQREVKSLKGFFEDKKTRILNDEAEKNGNGPVASTEKGGKGPDVKASK